MAVIWGGLFARVFSRSKYALPGSFGPFFIRQNCAYRSLNLGINRLNIARCKPSYNAGLRIVHSAKYHYRAVSVRHVLVWQIIWSSGKSRTSFFWFSSLMKSLTSIPFLQSKVGSLTSLGNDRRTPISMAPILPDATLEVHWGVGDSIIDFSVYIVYCIWLKWIRIISTIYSYVNVVPSFKGGKFLKEDSCGIPFVI